MYNFLLARCVHVANCTVRRTVHTLHGRSPSLAETLGTHCACSNAYSWWDNGKLVFTEDLIISLNGIFRK